MNFEASNSKGAFSEDRFVSTPREWPLRRSGSVRRPALAGARLAVRSRTAWTDGAGRCAEDLARVRLSRAHGPFHGIRSPVAAVPAARRGSARPWAGRLPGPDRRAP